MTATLRWSTLPELPNGWRVVVQCQHATTTVDVFGPPRLTDRQIEAVAIARHSTDCGCALQLDAVAGTAEGARA